MTVNARRLPDQDGTQLWLVRGPAEGLELEPLLALLSQDEIERWARFQVDHARDGFAVSRGVLRRILGVVLDRDPAALRFGRGPHGKPFLEDHDGDLQFNVSHSGDLFLYAVGRGGPIGVDVEYMKAERDLDRLAERFFAPGEVRRLLEEGRAQDRVSNFYRCWTRKEAYLKAKGLGITMPLDAFEVTFLPEESPCLLHTEVEQEDPATWRLSEIEVPRGYKAALVRGTPGS